MWYIFKVYIICKNGYNLYIHTYVCVGICISIYTYTHTHIHTLFEIENLILSLCNFYPICNTAIHCIIQKYITPECWRVLKLTMHSCLESIRQKANGLRMWGTMTTEYLVEVLEDCLLNKPQIWYHF